MSNGDQEQGASSRPDAIRLSFGRGTDNRTHETELPDGAVRRAVNVDITTSVVRRRSGYARIYSGTLIHSVYSQRGLRVFVENGSLKRLNADNSATELLAGVGHEWLSYDDLNGEIVFSNIARIGRVSIEGTARENGIESPSGQPALSASAAGGLDAGTYQVAMTFSRASGEEGGTSLAAQVAVSEGGGIVVANIPQPVSGDITAIHLYVTTANGMTFYHAMQLAVGQTSALVGRMILGRVLETQFLEPMPPGQIVRLFNGRLYVARNNLLIGSEPLRYGLTRLARNIIPFPSRIRMVQPVQSGLFVSDEMRTTFLRGQDLAQFTADPATSLPAFEYSGTAAPIEWFGQGAGEGAVWLTSEGHMLGGPDGSVTPLTKDRLALPESIDAAPPLLREAKGLRQLIHAARGASAATKATASDSVTTEVIRNGVLVS